MGRTVRVLGWVVARLLRIVWVSTMVLTPLFGFWLASSLAAYQNASQWLALLVGLLLFPILPVGWDLFFVWRRSRQPPRKAILTRLDRLVLRTLIVNGLFLGTMIFAAPHTAFRAVAVRGDWILDGHHGPIASSIRGLLFDVSDRFEHRWHKADDEFGKSDEAPTAPEPTTPTKPDEPMPVADWPMEDKADVIVTDMPADAQASIDSVAKFLAERITDKRRLIKALHDFVVLRMTYDHNAVEHPEQRPSQQAEAVFATRTAVCEGYSRLFVALGKAAGLDVAYVTGYVRTEHYRVDASKAVDDAKAITALEGYLHAWNAVQLDGRWMLVDTTWDDQDEADPRSTYLLTPPELFLYDHLPQEVRWELIASPISASEFVRRPILSPEAGKLGVTLDSPARSQVTVDGELDLIIGNPRHATLMAEWVALDGKSAPHECVVEQGTDKAKVHCTFEHGASRVLLFGGTTIRTATGTRSKLMNFGAVEVNSR